MQRAAPIIIVVALLVAATAAFVRAETLKAQKAPVYAPDFEGATFSPTCRCPTRVATMRFRVRPSGPVRVDVIDADGSFVRRLELVERDGSEVVARWAGLDRRGALAPTAITGCASRPAARAPSRCRTASSSTPARPPSRPVRCPR